MSKIKTKRIHHRIYAVQIGTKVYEVDGQVHEYGSKEWQLFEYDLTRHTGTGVLDFDQYHHGERHWIETYPTKGDALDDLAEMIR